MGIMSIFMGIIMQPEESVREGNSGLKALHEPKTEIKTASCGFHNLQEDPSKCKALHCQGSREDPTPVVSRAFVRPQTPRAQDQTLKKTGKPDKPQD